MGKATLSPLGRADLDDIWFHVARDNPRAADRLLDRIYTMSQLLADNPEMGQLQTDLADGRYRCFSVGPYVLYFRPLDDGIIIARVLHGSRDHSQLL